MCRASEQGIKDNLNENLKTFVDARIKEEQILLKDWTKHIVADQVRVSQNDLREWFNKQLNAVKRQFIVPGVIDDNGTYSDFKDFVNKITKSKSEKEAEG